MLLYIQGMQLTARCSTLQHDLILNPARMPEIRRRRSLSHDPAIGVSPPKP